MLVTSRSFDEYAAFFALDVHDLRERRILDCSAGASSFRAEAAARGLDAIAVDPAYADTEALIMEANAAAAHGTAIIDAHDDRFVWRWYGDPDRRAAMRAGALARFAEDLQRFPHRYVPGSLPNLPFADGAFDLALCSHLLFTWSDLFDEDWHDAALHELLRVAAEVRVFPLVVQGSGDPVEFLPALIDRLRATGSAVEVVQVPYEFQVGGDHLLRVHRT